MVIISSARRFSRTRRKREERIRERYGMSVGMISAW
jgi:hypothetical protein